MGFALALPFAVIDIIVATALMSLGMFMVPPGTIALPLKLLLFVVADGWALVVGALRDFIPMSAAADLLQQAFVATLMLAFPLLVLVGAAGVIVGVLQTLFQVQDQNVAFLPKVMLLAGLLWVGGPAALAVLVILLQTVTHAFPALIGG